MKSWMKFTVASLILPLVIACSNLSEREQVIADLAVQSATVRYIGDDKDRAQRVLDATFAIRVVAVADPNGTVLELAEVAKGLVPTEELTPQEILLANALIDLVVVEVADKVPGDTVLDEETLMKVTHYLDQVDVAARLILEG